MVYFVCNQCTKLMYIASQIYYEVISDNMKYSMVIVDIDYFKNINDTYGHDVGDHALFAMANLYHNSAAVFN